MATAVSKSRAASPFGELLEWFEGGMPAFRSMAHPMRVEDYEENGRYVIRAELPGVDPDKDVEVTVASGVLTVRAERREEQRDKQRSEFRYGSFERRLALPDGVNEEQVQARYRDGILEVSFPIGTEKPEARKVPIDREPTA